MKIKVATTFSYLSDSKDGQSGERFISSALTIEPDEDFPLDEADAISVECRDPKQCLTGIECCEPGERIVESTGLEGGSGLKKIEVPELKAPRFMVMGKPCTGKTTLSRQLCEQFGCELVNVTDLIEEHLTNQTEIGQALNRIMADGRDVTDELVISILKEKLQSPSCIENGYVLDGIPTHGEQTFSIEKQLNFVFSLDNPPVYLIDIQISNDELKNRWDEKRQDSVEGQLQPKQSSEAGSLSPHPNDVDHPNFPPVDSTTKNGMFTPYEELPECLDRHLDTYDSKVQGKVEDFMSKHDGSAIINVDGQVDPSDRFEEAIEKLRKVTTSQSHENSYHSEHPTTDGQALPQIKGFTVDKSLWMGHPPRLVFIGKPCTEKTTLAKALCDSWQCEYASAAELIQQHVSQHTEKGEEISLILSQGKELPETLVLDLLRERLNSPDCRRQGFILDDVPTLNESYMTLDGQIKFLEQLYPEPYFWVEINISDDELRERWNTLRAENKAGSPYTLSSHESSPVPPELSNEFQPADGMFKNQPTSCYEQLPEDIEAHFQFYNSHVAQPLADFLSRCQKDSVIQLDGALGLSELHESLIEQLRARIEQYGLKPASVAAGPVNDLADSVNRSPQPAHRTGPVKSTAVTNAADTSSQPSSDSRMSDYRGTVGDFRLRSHVRSTTSTSSLSSHTEPSRMANITCVSTDPCTLATTQCHASPKPAGFSMSMPDTGRCTQSRAASPSKQKCCCQCGAHLAEMSAQLWRNKPPRFLIYGKPCTGKTSLAKKMCQEWGCRLINGTDLILRHMAMNDSYGRRIKEQMLSGRDLDDDLMIALMTDELNSPECACNGFVIDDFPNYSEKSLSVSKQLDFLCSLRPGPDYIIELQISDDVLMARWESVKMDLESGNLYVDQNHEPRAGQQGLPASCCLSRCCRSEIFSERFPRSRELITRFEELAESMENNITFYEEVVEPQLRDRFEKYYSDVIIPMDGEMTVNEIFYMLKRKMRMILENPTIPPRQLFTDKENSFLPGSCCKRCGARYPNLEPQLDLWADDPPRIVILGKPCTGKTTLAKRLCAQWDCELVNATDLIQQHLALNTVTGKRIRSILSEGRDLPDNFVLTMLLEKLNSPGCMESGYILDGIPTHSEQSHSIVAQMDFLRSLTPPPDYLILIEISDEALRERWQSIRIDVADGTLYISRMFGHVGYHPGKPQGRRTRHPDFPQLDEETRNRLITRHEELPENLDKHFSFYNTYIAPQVQCFVRQHDPTKVIVLNGEYSSMKMLNTLLYKLNVMARNPNVPTAELFADSSSGQSDGFEGCGCRTHDAYLEPLTELWLDRPPRVLIVGKPCTGKTALAKRLCTMWKCRLIDASDLIQYELDAKSEMGQYIRNRLATGCDLEDQFVLDLIRKAVCNATAVDRGYILIGIPTHSELTMSIEDQLEFLRGLENGPEYIIEIQMDDAELRDRWEAIRIDVLDGALYNKLSYDRGLPISPGRRTRHPDFPDLDEATKKRLITRHEELPENLNLHFEFYHRKIEIPLQNYIAQHDPSKVVRVNGNLLPSELLQAVLTRLSIMSRHPGVDTAILFPSSNENLNDTDSTCQCQCADMQRVGAGIVWKDGVPRIMIVGNSCSGKTTLAKRLCTELKCTRVNASDLILENLNSRTTLGDHINNILCDGKDLDDDFVLRMIQDKLNSPECMERGYVLDDFPTSSEKGLPIWKQLEMLNNLPCRPEFIISIEIPEDALRRRWQSLRIDLADGVLYPDAKLSITNATTMFHPKFPTPTEKLRQRLITRHEDLGENVEKQYRFYADHVEPHIVEFMKQYDENCIITVDGTRSQSEVYQTISNMFRNGKATATKRRNL